MIHLIDKDALVAEIERMKADALQKKEQCKRSGLERIMHQIGAYNKILSLINTLDVKDLDLEKEPASEDLEQAANEFGIRQGIELKPFAIKFFKAGTQWQKEQILKDAIECEVSQTMVDVIPMDSIEILPDGLFLDKSKFKVGDKVKVIVLPSE